MGERLLLRGVLISAVLLAVLYFLLTPMSWPIDYGRRIICKNQLKCIGFSVECYKHENGGKVPAYITDLIIYIGGEANVSLFFCPTRKRSLKGTPPGRISDLAASPQYFGYDFLSATSTVPGNTTAENIIPLMCDKPGNHGKGGINILFFDCHTAWWPSTIEEYAASNQLLITVNTNWVR